MIKLREENGNKERNEEKVLAAVISYTHTHICKVLEKLEKEAGKCSKFDLWKQPGIK